MTASIDAAMIIAGEMNRLRSMIRNLQDENLRKSTALNELSSAYDEIVSYAESLEASVGERDFSAVSSVMLQEMQRMRGEIRELRETLQQLRDDCARAEKQHDEDCSRITLLTRELQTARASLASTEEQLQTAKAEIEDLTSRLSAAETDARLSREEAETSRCKAAQLEDELHLTNGRVDQTHQSLEEARHQVDEILIEKDMIIRDLEAVKARLDQQPVRRSPLGWVKKVLRTGNR